MNPADPDRPTPEATIPTKPSKPTPNEPATAAAAGASAPPATIPGKPVRAGRAAPNRKGAPRSVKPAGAQPKARKAKARAAVGASKAKRATAPRKAKRQAPVDPSPPAAILPAADLGWQALPEPGPTAAMPAVVVAPPPKARGLGVGRILIVGLLVVALAALGVATQVTSEPNTGSLKVHDGPAADPETRNEPHVAGDFFIEGSKMASDGGALLAYSWPPTGDMTLVLDTEWDADGGTPANHFLAGPFELPCGHYRVFAYNGDGPDDPTEPQPGGAKKKTFWVECPEAPGPEPTPTTSTGPSPSPTSSTGPTPSPTTSTGPSPTPEPRPEPEMQCPADLTATPQPDGSIQLDWTPAAGSDGTNLYRADGDGEFHYLATADAGVAAHVDQTSAAGGAYSYLATGLYGNQESVGCPLVEVTAIPDFPTLAGAALALGGSLAAFAWAARRRLP